MERLTARCSTILISVGGQTRVYHSVEEIPDKLRERLLETTRGLNAATILIADRGGREEILKAVRQARDDRYSRLARVLASARPGPQADRSRWLALAAGAGRILLLGCLAYAFWALCTLR
jgi:hypothetical protein